jgi:hypothetical protein
VVYVRLKILLKDRMVNIIFILLLLLLLFIWRRDSSVGIATGYGMDDQGGREFVSR